MKILAEFNGDKVIIINTFNSLTTNIHAPVEVATIIKGSGDMENVPFRVLKIIDKAYLPKEN